MPNRYDLQGRVAIVTGSAKGIGRAVVETLIESGAEVVAWDQHRTTIPNARSELVDVTRPDEIAAALRGHPGRIDILANVAGYLGSTASFVDHALQEWRRIIEVNLVGTLNVTHAVLPRLLAQRSGRIINFGSLAGKEGLATLAGYSAASGGVIAFTKALSREVVGDNVFVNCVAPGPIDTDMIRDLGAAAVDRMIADSPVRRLGTVAEVAQLVAWLCSDASRYNTGAIFDMSGGRARY